MLSEIDLRDWDKVDVELVRQAVEDINNPHNMGYDPYNVIFRFIDQVEAIMKKQVPQVAVLLKESNG